MMISFRNAALCAQFMFAFQASAQTVDQLTSRQVELERSIIWANGP
jgi:hypothetical protein